MAPDGAYSRFISPLIGLVCPGREPGSVDEVLRRMRDGEVLRALNHSVTVGSAAARATRYDPGVMRLCELAVAEVKPFSPPDQFRRGAQIKAIRKEPLLTRTLDCEGVVPLDQPIALHRIRRRSEPMIRCVRLWTGEDRNSRFEDGYIDLDAGARGDLLSGTLAVTGISFQETKSGGTFAWHVAPIRQLVITLSGTLDFQTREGEHFILRPGDILLAEDTVGSGHSWRLTDDQPWRRAYVILAPGAPVPFLANRKTHLSPAMGED